MLSISSKQDAERDLLKQNPWLTACMLGTGTCAVCAGSSPLRLQDNMPDAFL